MSSSPHRGLLVAVEGIDGAGKTTQVHLVRSRLEARGWPVVTSKEPTDGPWGRKIRATASTGRLSPEEELNAFLADRREHVDQLIRPSLAAGRIVILDRYYFSTIAYQGIRGRDPEELRALNESFAPRPDLLVVLDIDPERALGRIQGRGDQANHFERAHLLEQSRAIFARYLHEGPRTSPDGRPCFTLKLDSSEAPDDLAARFEARILEVAAFSGLAFR